MQISRVGSRRRATDPRGTRAELACLPFPLQPTSLSFLSQHSTPTSAQHSRMWFLPLLPLGLPLLSSAFAQFQQAQHLSTESSFINAKTSNLTLASLPPSFASDDGFLRLHHPDIPTHSMRIKETTGWCETKAQSFVGYLDVGDEKELFFYFFTSRRDPSKDDVVMSVKTF